MSIPHQFIDVDFQDIPEDQSAGLIPQTDEQVMFGASEIVGSFESEYPKKMVPASKRKEMAQRKWPNQRKTIYQIYSQGRTSACVGFGAAQTVEITRARRYGKKFHVPLSGMSVYKEIGRTLMSGAMISDGMNQIVKVGALPLDTPENRDKFELVWGLQDWSRRFPSGWEQHAKPFRVTKWAKAYGKDEIESAMLHDFVGIVGRDWHCVPYCGLTYEGNTPYIPYANSWSTNWGDKGIGYDSQRVYRSLTLYVAVEVTVSDDVSFPAIAI